MPKEIIHLLTAEKLRDRLRDDAPGPVLDACPNSLLLGAVFHDILYYLRNRPFQAPWPESVADLPNKFHSIDSAELLTRQNELMIAEPGNTAAQGIFAGMVSHMCADTAMHPLVVHCTGNYHDPDPAARTRAVRLHRAMETAMDLAACGGLHAARSFDLQRIRSSFEGNLHRSIPVKWMADAAGINERTMKEALESALKTFILTRRIGSNRAIGTAADFLHPLLPSKAREITALFYSPSLARAARLLRGPIAWTDPCDGTQHESTLEDLMDTAAEHSAEICRRVWNGLRSGTAADLGPALSLESGKPADKELPPRHIAPHPLVEY